MLRAIGLPVLRCEVVEMAGVENRSNNRNVENEIRDLPINEFINTNFKKRTCKEFIPANSWSSTCGCGYEHKHDTESSTVKTTETWEIQKHTETSATDAFGDVKFPISGHKIAKYIRVDYETNIEDLVKLMLEYWKMKTPRLLISVTGGSQDFTIKPRLEQVFCQGLVKAAESTRTWIITEGTNTGVSKYVGKALRYNTIKYGKKKQLIALGIASWGYIANRNDLIPDEVRVGKSKESNGCWPASYKVTRLRKKEKESPLDPNHTHFILVDNGTQQQFGVEKELRTRLEIEISKKVSHKESDLIPMVCVVLEGGPDTIKKVKETVEKGTPVVIVKDSGRAADVLTFAYEKCQQHKGQKEIDSRQRACVDSSPQEPNQNDSIQSMPSINSHYSKPIYFPATTGDLWNEVASQIRVKFGGSLSDSEIKTYVGYVRVCVENFDHLLSIFHLESGSSAINFTILNAALHIVNRGIDQLRLALAFDGIDAAKEKIFIDGVNFEESQLDDLMLFAIQNNRVAFVKLFLEKGVRLPTSFGKEEILRKKLCQIPWAKAKVKTMPQEEIFKSLLKDFGVGPDVLWPDDVFLWSVVAMHRELAMVLLGERKKALALVVAAHSISRTLLRNVPDPEFNKELSEQVTFYEELAVGLLSEYYLSDQRKSMQLIVAKNYWFGTILNVAVQADNKNFVAHPACQEHLTEVWTGKLSDDNHLFKLLTAIFCPFVAPLLLKFRDNTAFRSVSATDDSSVTRTADSSQTSEIRCAAYFKKILYFFQAPEIKCSYNFLSHLVFLLLYSIILLTDFYPKIGIKEKILIAWVATLIIEEIRQIIVIRKRLYNYITDIWNIMDVITIVTFLAGMILRFIPVSICGHCFYAARIVLAFNFMSFFFRILHVFSIHRKLGPKLVMIGKMMIDLFYFMIILVVFIAAYGIASHVILYPNQPLNIALARDVLSRSWWNIFGELGIDEVSGEACDNRTLLPYAEQCASMDADEFSSYGCSDYKADKCPSINWLIPIILAIYVLIANVLMFNLLIAMFSNTFSNIQVQTNVVWKTQRYHLVREYKSRPMLPPPLNIIFYLLIGWKKLNFLCTSREAFPNWKAYEELLRWEKPNAEEYLQKSNLHYKTGDKEGDFNDKLDLILSKQEDISKRLTQLEKQVCDTLKEEKEEITRELNEEIASEGDSMCSEVR